MTGAQRQAKYYAKHRKRILHERIITRERERIAELFRLDPKPQCRCCGERSLHFLIYEEGRTLCRNCAYTIKLFDYCSAHAPGVTRRLS